MREKRSRNRFKRIIRRRWTENTFADLEEMVKLKGGRQREKLAKQIWINVKLSKKKEGQKMSNVFCVK